MSKLSYIVVENSGRVGECDVGRFPTYHSAARWMERTYTAAERDPASRNCLHPAICVEEPNGKRSFEV